MSSCETLRAFGRRCHGRQGLPTPRRRPEQAGRSRTLSWMLAATGGVLLGLLLFSAIDALDDLAGAVHLLA